jgi:hypothetical protein
MRFGRPNWSRDGDSFTYHLILVDKAYDEGRKSIRLGSENDRARATLAEYEGMVEHLLQTLVGKQLLSTTEIDAIRKAARAGIWDRHHAFDEVEDVNDDR